MKSATWHTHKATGRRVFGHELEPRDETERGDVYESTDWRLTSRPGDILTPAIVGRTRYIRPARTPAEQLGITPAELGALVGAASVAPTTDTLLASLFDKLSPGDDAIARVGGRA